MRFIITDDVRLRERSHSKQLMQTAADLFQLLRVGSQRSRTICAAEANVDVFLQNPDESTPKTETNIQTRVRTMKKGDSTFPGQDQTTQAFMDEFRKRIEKARLRGKSTSRGQGPRPPDASPGKDSHTAAAGSVAAGRAYHIGRVRDVLQCICLGKSVPDRESSFSTPADMTGKLPQLGANSKRGTKRGKEGAYPRPAVPDASGAQHPRGAYPPRWPNRRSPLRRRESFRGAPTSEPE
jgi:hypothetical protein